MKLPDPLPETDLADISTSGVIFRIDVLQTIAVIKHTVWCHTDPAFPEFLNTLTFHNVSKEEIDVRLHVFFFCFYFFCKSSLTDDVLFFHYFFRIQNCCTEEFLLIHLLINIHRCFRIFWLYDQQKLIISHIAFHSIVPSFIPDLQKVCKDLYGNKFSTILLQPVLQFQSRLFQFFWICFSPLFQLF